jgi:hypothetical protein
MVFVYGWANGGMAAVEPARITDAQLAEGLAKQLEWLRNNDEISPNAPTLSGEDSGVPGKKP